MKRRILSLLVACAAALSLAVPARADKLITLDQVPEQARAVIRHNVGNGRIGSIELEQAPGKQDVYDVNYETTGGAKYRLKVAGDGKLVVNEPM